MWRPGPALRAPAGPVPANVMAIKSEASHTPFRTNSTLMPSLPVNSRLSMVWTGRGHVAVRRLVEDHSRSCGLRLLASVRASRPSGLVRLRRKYLRLSRVGRLSLDEFARGDRFA